jgi:hypothetical protein
MRARWLFLVVVGLVILVPAAAVGAATQVRTGSSATTRATRILQKTGSSTGIAWYIVGCCVLAMVALLLMPRRRTTEDTQVFDVAPADYARARR